MAGIRCFRVNVFTNRPFAGNPAVVCFMEAPRDATWMQAVAAELNFSETAFVRPVDDGFSIRWFSPLIEIELCAHATLASAHALWTDGVVRNEEPIRFHAKSEVLTCRQAGDFIAMDFPSMPATEADPPVGLLDALGIRPSFVGTLIFNRFLAVVDEEIVRSLKPNFDRLRSITGMRGVIVTSRSSDPRFDFISRYFAPSAGVDEDAVTGSAHCCLGPFWGERLGKTQLTGYQASSRGGEVRVGLHGDRVLLEGQAVTVLRGELLQ